MESNWILGPGEVIGEGAVSVIVEAPGLKESWREVETWCQKAGTGFRKRVQEKLLVEVQPSCSSRSHTFGDAGTVR